jgi:hypothetical protein
MIGSLFSQRLPEFFLTECCCRNMSAEPVLSALLSFPKSHTGQSDNQRDTEK